MALPPGFVDELVDALGAGFVITEPERLATYDCDGLTGWRAQPACVALPGSAPEVQAVLRLCAREGIPFVAVLAKPTDDVRPEDFVAFQCDGSFGIQIFPEVWHQPAAPIGQRMTIDNKQGRVHACVDFNALTEFGCYLEVPLAG